MDESEVLFEKLDPVLPVLSVDEAEVLPEELDSVLLLQTVGVLPKILEFLQTFPIILIEIPITQGMYTGLQYRKLLQPVPGIYQGKSGEEKRGEREGR